MLGLRAATAAILLGVFAGALFLAPDALWIALCVLALVPAAWEWGRLSRLSSAANGAFTATAAAALLALIYLPLSDAASPAYALTAFFWILLAPAWLRRRPAVPAGLLALTGWIVLVPAYLALVNLRAQGPGLLLGIMAIVWVSDTAAYFAGRRFGKHKLAPAVSPGKTWEGFWAALAAVAFYAGLTSFLAPHSLPAGVSGPALVAAALGLAVLGVIGDLFESQLKRAAGVKDSGTTLPGHGGVLDRIDALLPVVPVAAWLLGRFGQ